MPLTIQDKLVILPGNGSVRPLPRGLIVASPSSLPVFVTVAGVAYEIQGTGPQATSAQDGSYTLVLPWNSECAPNNLTWQIALPDGTIWGGTVPEGISGPVTIKQLKDTYGWGLVQGPASGPINVIQGPPGSGGGGGLDITLPIYGGDPNGNSAIDSALAVQLAHNALPAYGGMIWMPKGIYYFKTPIVFTKPNVILKGEGEATEIISTTTLADGQAQITCGTVASPNGIDHCQFLDFYMHRAAVPAGGGTGSGIRAGGQRTIFQNLHLQWFAQDGIVVDTADGFDCTVVSTTATTVTVPTGLGAKFSNGQQIQLKKSGNQETPTITGIAGDVLTVSPNLANSYTAGFLSRGTNYFESFLLDCTVESVGRDCYVFSARMFNAEAIRCVAHGGKNLSPYAGRHGFYIRGTQVKLLLCHPYFCPQNGVYVDGTAGGIEGKEITVQGGEFENNGGVGIWLYSCIACDVSGVLTYANGRRPDLNVQTQDILLSFGSDHRVCHNSVDPQARTHQQINGAGDWALGGDCICLSGSQKNVIAHNACQEGAGNGIRLDGLSKWNVIAHNQVHSLVTASAAIRLDNSQENEVFGNVVDGEIGEPVGTTVNGADYNRYYGNKFTLASQSIARANSSVAVSPYTGNHSTFRDNTCTPDGSNYTGTAYAQATSVPSGNNGGCNPVGPLPTPNLPATTVAYQNLYGVDATVYVTGGTVTQIAVGNTSGATTPTGLTSGPVRVKANQWITITYTVAPTWSWYGE